MNLSPLGLTIKSSVIFLINVVLIYTAAFVYRFNWPAMILVLAIVPNVTTIINRIITKNFIHLVDETKESAITSVVSIMIMYGVSALATFLILIFRFNFPTAIGVLISGWIVSGILSSIVHKI
jgi:hypothetical protein